MVRGFGDGLPIFGPLYQLLLLTGQRRDEVAGMAWSEIDFEKRTWTIPKIKTKNAREHIVHCRLKTVSVHYARHGGTEHGDIGRANASPAGTGSAADFGD